MDVAKIFSRSAAEAQALPLTDKDRSEQLFAHGSMRVKYYSPKAVDTQTPHRQDELYVVIAGKGTFVCADQTVGFEPGTVIFAPAGVEHRFQDFSDDFCAWVIFYGPDGGES